MSIEVETERNDGRVHASGQSAPMENQCMWISILDGLRSHKLYEKCTVRGLKNNAFGKLTDTDSIMFDTIDPMNQEALVNLCEKLRINIRVWAVRSDGNKTYLKLFSDPANIVTAANFCPTGEVAIEWPNSVEYCLTSDKTDDALPHPTTLHIASFGAHFEYIKADFIKTLTLAGLYKENPDDQKFSEAYSDFNTQYIEAIQAYEEGVEGVSLQNVQRREATLNAMYRYHMSIRDGSTLGHAGVTETESGVASDSPPRAGFSTSAGPGRAESPDQSTESKFEKGTDFLLDGVLKNVTRKIYSFADDQQFSATNIFVASDSETVIGGVKCWWYLMSHTLPEHGISNHGEWYKESNIIREQIEKEVVAVFYSQTSKFGNVSDPITFRAKFIFRGRTLLEFKEAAFLQFAKTKQFNFLFFGKLFEELKVWVGSPLKQYSRVVSDDDIAVEVNRFDMIYIGFAWPGKFTLYEDQGSYR